MAYGARPAGWEDMPSMSYLIVLICIALDVVVCEYMACDVWVCGGARCMPGRGAEM